jgi:co-chaperonin GroES (HSP10)
MTMSNIIPIRAHVLVKPCEGDSISEGGIIVPESFREESNKVEVIAVGNGTKSKPMKYRKGQIAFRVKAWGTPVQEDGELYYLMDQDALLATLN